jgi:predicted DNA-binding mobile mystery protein A
MKNTHRTMARRRLDERLGALGSPERFTPPPKGWVQAIRDALGMTAAQLGARLGVKPQTVADLEKSEAQGTIQLNTLRKAAEAMDCTLVYALVPNGSLEGMVRARAETMAKDALGRIGHTMALEGQELPKARRQEQIDEYIRLHLKERDLWSLKP